MQLSQYFDRNVVPVLNFELGEVELKYSHYPVIDSECKLIATIEADEIFHINPNQSSLDHELAVTSNSHPLFCIQLMQNIESNILFVLDESGLYLGAITENSILEYLQDTTSLNPSQSILELEINPQLFSISDLSHTIESEGIHIQYFSKCPTDHGMVRITLTLDKNNLSNILGVLEYKGYKIIQTYNETGATAIVDDRYQNLIHFLSI